MRFNFHLTNEERAKLFDFIVENKGIISTERISGNFLINNPELRIINSSAEFNKELNEGVVGFFIFSKIFKKQEVIIKPLLDTNRFYLLSRHGGPYVDLFCFSGFPENSPIRVKSTIIDYYSSWVDIERTNEEWLYEFKAPQELKDYANMLFKFCKSMCKQVEGRNGKKYWVSKELVEKGEY